MTPRRVQRADLAAIATLWRELIDHHAENLPLGAGTVPTTQLDALVRGVDCVGWIAEDTARAVGFCVARVEAAPPSLREPRRALITELYVRPGERRRGVGRALLGAALEWARARGAARVEVRVAARNAEGQAFWRAQGFGDFVDVLDRRL